MSKPASKICSKCGVEKPATADYFTSDKKSKDRLCSQCKACKLEYYHNNKERRKESNRKYRNLPSTKERRKQYQEDNRQRISQKSQQYYQDNRQRISQKVIWYNQPGNNERLNKKRRAYRSDPDNNERINKQRREYRARVKGFAPPKIRKSSRKPTQQVSRKERYFTAFYKRFKGED